MNDFELKEICEGLPGWAHWIVWVFVLGFHFLRVHFVKQKVITEFLGPTQEKPKENTMSTELGASGVIVDYKDGSAVVSSKDGAIVLTVKTAALLNPLIDGFAAKVQSGEVDLIKGTDLDKDVLLMALSAIKAEINK